MNKLVRSSLERVLFVLCMLALAACSSLATDKPNFESLPELSDVEWEVTLRNGDLLEVGVARDPDYLRKLPVGADGIIDLPVVGEVLAAGKSRSALRKEIEIRLVEAKYYTDPQVTINVLESREPPQVAVIGAVRSPVVIPYRRDLSLGFAIAHAQGFVEDEAFLRPVIIVRSALDNPQVFRFDVADAIERSKPWPRLLPGDIIVAQGSTYRDIERSVRLARDFAVTISQPAVASREIDRLVTE